LINLLKLQRLDTNIADCIQKEKELPRQKDKFFIQKERLAEEIKNSEEHCRKIQAEQRECEAGIEQLQEKIKKYEGQLPDIKRNEEYKAVLHEIEMQKKQISNKEERVLVLMDAHEEALAKLEEDKTRVQGEISKLDAECAAIDADLAELVQHRKALQAKRPELKEEVEPQLLSLYERIRKVRVPAVVPLNAESCGGCFMTIRPQIVNEIMGSEKVHTCQHCHRILYYPDNVSLSGAETIEESA